MTIIKYESRSIAKNFAISISKSKLDVQLKLLGDLLASEDIDKGSYERFSAKLKDDFIESVSTINKAGDL